MLTIINENKVSPEKNTDSTTKQETPVVSAKGEALVQPTLPEYKESTSDVSKEENKPQNKVAALVNEKPEFPLEELEKLKKEQDALKSKESTESKQGNKETQKDNLLDKKDELKGKLTDKKEDIKKETKDLFKDESTPKGSDLFDNLANKSSNHNEDTPRIEKKELPKTSSTNSSGLAGIGALGVGLGAVIATRKKKLNR